MTTTPDEQATMHQARAAAHCREAHAHRRLGDPAGAASHERLASRERHAAATILRWERMTAKRCAASYAQAVREYPAMQAAIDRWQAGAAEAETAGAADTAAETAPAAETAHKRQWRKIAWLALAVTVALW